MYKHVTMLGLGTMLVMSGAAHAQNPMCDEFFRNPQANPYLATICAVAKGLEDGTQSLDDVRSGRRAPRNEVERAMKQLDEQERRMREWTRNAQEARARERREAFQALERQRQRRFAEQQKRARERREQLEQQSFQRELARRERERQRAIRLDEERRRREQERRELDERDGCPPLYYRDKKTGQCRTEFAFPPDED